MVGEQPKEKQDEPQHAEDESQQAASSAQSHPRGRMVAGQAAKPCQEGAQSQAGGQEVDRPVGRPVRLGRPVRGEQGAFRLDQRPLARFSRDADLAQEIAHSLRQKRLVPQGDGCVGRPAQAQVEAEVLGKKIRSHAQRVRSKSHGRWPLAGLPDPPAHRAVDGIAHASGAVVPEVVIEVFPIFGPRVFTQALPQGPFLGGRQIELLFLDRPVVGNIRRRSVFHPRHRQPVLESATQEIGNERGRVEGKGAEVVDQPALLVGLHQDGVVPELEKRMIAGAKGENSYGQVVSRLGSRVPRVRDHEQRQRHREENSQAHGQRTYQVTRASPEQIRRVPIT